MEEERIDEIEESSPLDEEVDSSTTEETSEELVEEPTSQEGTVEKPPPFHEHPRWKEVQQEKEYWRQQAERLSQFQQPQIKESDPYEQFQDPQTRVFYQDMDKRVERIVNKKIESEKAALIRQNEILAKQLASVQHKMFKEENTDVVEGSAEEARIAQLVSSGVMNLQEATWAVMGPKRVASAQSGRQQNVKKKTEMKAKANLATSGVPTNSGLPSERQSFLDDLSESLDKDWNQEL